MFMSLCIRIILMLIACLSKGFGKLLSHCQWPGHMQLHLCKKDLLLCSQGVSLNGCSMRIISATRRRGQLEHLHATKAIRHSPQAAGLILLTCQYAVVKEGKSATQRLTSKQQTPRSQKPSQSSTRSCWMTRLRYGSNLMCYRGRFARRSYACKSQALARQSSIKLQGHAAQSIRTPKALRGEK